MNDFYRCENAKVTEIIKNDFNETKRIKIEVPPAGNRSWPKRVTVSWYNYQGEVPPVGSIINVQGEPSYDVADQPSPKTGKRSVYVTIWHPQIEILGMEPQAPDVYTVEQAAQLLASAPASESEAPF